MSDLKLIFEKLTEAYAASPIKTVGDLIDAKCPALPGVGNVSQSVRDIVLQPTQAQLPAGNLRDIMDQVRALVPAVPKKTVSEIVGRVLQQTIDMQTIAHDQAQQAQPRP